MAAADLGDRAASSRRAGPRRPASPRRSGSPTNAATRPSPAVDDGPLQLVGERLGVGEGRRARPAGAVRVRRGHVPEPPEPRLVRPAERRAAGQVERAQRVAVIAAPPREDDVAVGLAHGEVVGPGELEGGLDRLGAAGDRVQVRVVDREMDADLGRVGLERLGREGAAVGEGEAGGLVGHRRRDRGPAVADADDDRAARRVEVLATLGVDDGRAMRLHRDRRIGDRRAAEDVSCTHGPMVADGPREPVWSVAVYRVRLTAEASPTDRRRTHEPRTCRRRRVVRDPRAPLPGRRLAHGVPRRPGGRCCRCRPGCLREGLRRAAPLPGGRAGPAVAAQHRRERGPQPSPIRDATRRTSPSAPGP